MKVRIFLFCQLTKGKTGYSKIINREYLHCIEFLREIELTFLISKKTIKAFGQVMEKGYFEIGKYLLTKVLFEEDLVKFNLFRYTAL
ncbi:hypothetical protein B1F79_00270 [Coxiella-like endosymbiont of Rhipicephalus sanguineus]|nr:hypothetical protein [Coxiella-like endosymbiont of Rhipicephalus sanguineus]